MDDRNMVIGASDLFTLFSITPDLVCIAGKDGYFKRINPAVSAKLEYSTSELLSMPIDALVHPDDRKATAAKRLVLIDRGGSLLNFQNRYISKSGKVIWLEWTSAYLIDKELVFAIAKDVTAKKIIEKDLEEQYKKIRNLAEHFKSSIEQDRKDMAEALHEELAQLASAVRLDLDWLASNIPDLSDAATLRIQQGIAVSDLLVDTIRKMSFSMSPSMLRDVGMDATLEWFCKEFSKSENIACTFVSKYDEALLSEEIKLDFFRICQQALSNVSRHSLASRATVTIEDSAEGITLTVWDNGSGFHFPDNKKGPGLQAMAKRAFSINASFTVDSEPGKGTSVRLTVPRSA